MEITLLIKSIVGLVVILGILIFILLLPKDKKKKKEEGQKKLKNQDNKLAKKTDFESLRQVIRNRLSSKKELSSALDLVMKHHGNIPNKLGVRVNPQFDGYMEILMMICRHPNTSKDIILKFDKELRKKNPNYEVDINKAIAKGLESRGF